MARESRQSRAAFLAIAVFFHLVFVFSIFDIYFVSPIVSGMREYEIQRETEPPAQRLVLFVGMFFRVYLFVKQWPVNGVE